MTLPFHVIEDDDFVESSIQKKFIDKVFGSGLVKWRLSNIVTFLNDAEESFTPEITPTTIVDKNSKPIFQIIGDLEHKEYEEIFSAFCLKHKIDVTSIIRARVVVTTTSIDENKHSYPHVDHLLDHDVFLYYVNTSDGDTVFFDKVLGEDSLNPKIVKRSTPIAGKAINFSGKIFHALFLTNKKTVRCILNIEYKRKK